MAMVWDKRGNALPPILVGLFAHFHAKNFSPQMQFHTISWSRGAQKAAASQMRPAQEVFASHD